MYSVTQNRGNQFFFLFCVGFKHPLQSTTNIHIKYCLYITNWISYYNAIGDYFNGVTSVRLAASQRLLTPTNKMSKIIFYIWSQLQ